MLAHRRLRTPIRFSREWRDGIPAKETENRSVTDAELKRKLDGFSYLNMASIGLRLFFVKMVPNPLRTPRMVANQIRLLRRHEQTTAIQRHSPSNVTDRGGEGGWESLEALCRELLTYHFAAKEVHTTRDEILTLCANDPGVYLAFETTLGTEFSSREADSILGQKVIHNFWSKLIGQPEFEEDSKFSYKNIINLTSYSDFYVSQAIMLEYLAIALPFDLKFGAVYTRLLQAWVDFVRAFPSITPVGYFRWDKFDLCAKAIFDTGKPIDDFLSPRLFSIIGRNLYTYSDLVPFIVSTFFAIPEVKILRRGKDIFGAELSYSPLTEWNLVNLSTYALSMEYELGTSSPSKLVFSEKLWMALYHISATVLSTYFHQNGLLVTAETGFIKDLAEGSVALLSKNNDHNYTEEGAQAAFYVAQFFDIDRYYKRTVVEVLLGVAESINLLHRHSRFMNRFEVRDGLYDLAFMPQFENVPYLRRYRIRDYIFITSDDPPAMLSRLVDGIYEHAVLDYSVDTMLLDGHSLVCLRISGEEKYFGVTGHFPILAGYNASGLSLYVAAVRKDKRWYFNTVEAGARLMTYFDELGEECSASDFFVLALRHDPSDYPPPYPRARKGAMDPTGPVFWLKFWPEKDPHYYEDPRLTDDRILESFLNDARDRNEQERCLLRGFKYCKSIKIKI